MAGIYFYNYNNYYNRRLKRKETLEAYGTPLYYEIQNLNFNPSDGVNTVYVAGRQNNPYPGTGNYVIYSADNTTITSRWFIIEQTRNLQGQYTVQLRRDVVADYYNNILVSPAFIEKAILKDSDPFIYNDEQMTVNQIKTYTKDIKDRSNCAWIVGYLDRKYAGGEIDITGVTIPDITVDSLANWEYNKYRTTTVKALNTDILQLVAYQSESDYDYANGYYTQSSASTPTATPDWEVSDRIRIKKPSAGVTRSPFIPNTTFSRELLLQTLKLEFDFTKWTPYKTQYLPDFSSYSQVDYDALLTLDGQTIYDKGSNKYYKIELSVNKTTEGQAVAIPNDSITGQEVIRILNKQLLIEGMDNFPGAYVTYSYGERQISLINITPANVKITMPASTARYHLKDAPYDMFCIPYEDNYEITDDTTNPTFTLVSQKLSALNIAQGIAEALGTNLYDIQLLPFCPFTGYTMVNDHKMSLNCKGDNLRYTLLKVESTNQSLIVWSTASSGNSIINPNVSYTENLKLGNQCDKMRIVSPNYNGMYEFSPAKNKGLQSLYISFTYLPYQPFIRIKPQFGGIYAPADGKQFDDATGIICQGDFSISYLSDKWAEYQIQNKNYNNIFDREVKNLELSHKLAREQEPLQIAAGVVSGATGGAMSGGVVGGLAGGIAGGILGGAASLAAGLKDREVNETLRQEALDYKRDMFGFQLGNIKALPNSITKVTAYNIINNIFPIIEFYTCTKEEKKAVANKIAWNSMTVGRIDSIINFINNSWEYAVSTEEVITDQGYIKAKIIRIDGIADDFHLLNAISDELNKGVYFK